MKSALTERATEPLAEGRPPAEGRVYEKTRSSPNVSGPRFQKAADLGLMGKISA